IRLSAIWRVVSACFDSCRESPKSKDSQALRMRTIFDGRKKRPHAEEPALAGVSKHAGQRCVENAGTRSEEHTTELQSLMRISYAGFCVTKKNNKHTIQYI